MSVQDGRRAALVLLLAVGLGVFAEATAGASAVVTGEGGGSPTESTPASNCSQPNPPNQLTLVAGTPQTTLLDTPFASNLQVALANSDGCAVTGAAGIPVTFSAPFSGPSGSFSASNANTVTVGTNASGAAVAPTFTANTIAGSYTLTASSRYGSVSFSMTNTAAGIPARIVALPLKRHAARVGTRFAQPLQVKVLDADGNLVPGASVTFTLGTATASRCATAAASASFLGGASQATVSTGANGLASSPDLSANTASGSFTATALLSSGGAGGVEGAGKAGSGSVAPVSFSLANLAGKPVKLTAGVGATQSTRAGTSFPIRLAVTVTDAHENPVPGALITFSAPAAGASGRFTVYVVAHRHHSRRHRVYRSTVEVKTGACGIAVAPPFIANDAQGGYIVKATVKHAKPVAAFALVNEAPERSP